MLLRAEAEWERRSYWNYKLLVHIAFSSCESDVAYTPAENASAAGPQQEIGVCNWAKTLLSQETVGTQPASPKDGGNLDCIFSFL